MSLDTSLYRARSLSPFGGGQGGGHATTKSIHLNNSGKLHLNNIPERSLYRPKLPINFSSSGGMPPKSSSSSWYRFTYSFNPLAVRMCSLRNSSAERAILKYRFWEISTGTLCICLSGIAQCSGGIKRWWKSLPRRISIQGCGRRCAIRQFRLAAR